jgi:hypothetical protein
MNYQGRVLFNAKPYLAIQQINLTSIRQSHLNYTKRLMEYNKKIDGLDLSFRRTPWDRIRALVDNDKDAHTVNGYGQKYLYDQDSKTRDPISKFSARSIHQFKITTTINHAQYEQHWHKLEIFLNSTFPTVKHDANAHDREKRFLFPLLGFILPVAKIIGLGTLQVMAERVTDTLRHQGANNLTKHLKANGTSVVQIRDRNIKSAGISDIFTNWKMANIDIYAWENQIYTMPEAQREQSNHLYQMVEQETIHLNNLRQTLQQDLEILHQSLIQLAKGTLTAQLVSYETMRKTITTITESLRVDESPLIFPIPEDRIPEMYQFVTPFLLTDHNILYLFMIFPLFQPASILDMYSVTTYPFLTTENIAVELIRDHKYFAKSASNDHTTTFDENTLDNCAMVSSMRFCRSPRPLKRSNSDCLSSLHSTNVRNKNIQQLCSFKTVPAKIARFEFIAPNTYAFYLPTQMDLKLTCTKFGPDNTNDITLNRTGIFNYPTKCYATVADYTFYDTNMESVKSNITIPNNIPSFAEFLQYSADGDINNDEVLRQLVIVNSQNNTQPQSILTLISTSKISQLRRIQKQVKTALDIDIPQQFINFVAGVLTLVSTHLIVSICYCRRRCNRHRQKQIELEEGIYKTYGDETDNEYHPSVPLQPDAELPEHATYHENDGGLEAMSPFQMAHSRRDLFSQQATTNPNVAGLNPGYTGRVSTLPRHQSRAFVDQSGTVYKLVDESPV